MEYVVGTLIIAGSLIVFISSVGMFRIPETYVRLHISSKAATVGLSLLILGVMIHFREAHAIFKSLMFLVFIFLIMPITGHIIALTQFNQNKKKQQRPNKKEESLN